MQPERVVPHRPGLPPPGRHPFRHPDTPETSINRAAAANQLRTRSPARAVPPPERKYLRAPLLQHGLSPSPGGRASAGHPNCPNLPTMNAVQPACVGLGSCGPQGRRGTAPFHSSQVSNPPMQTAWETTMPHTEPCTALGRARPPAAALAPAAPARESCLPAAQPGGTQHVRLTQAPPRLAALVGAACGAPSGMLTSVCYATHAPGYTCRPCPHWSSWPQAAVECPLEPLHQLSPICRLQRGASSSLGNAKPTVCCVRLQRAALPLALPCRQLGHAGSGSWAPNIVTRAELVAGGRRLGVRNNMLTFYGNTQLKGSRV